MKAETKKSATAATVALNESRKARNARQTATKVAKVRKQTKPELKELNEPYQIIPSHRRDSGLVYGIKLLTRDLTRQPLDLRVYSTAATTWCCVWLSHNGVMYSASYKATGYGYDRKWASIQGALAKLINLPNGMTWYDIWSDRDITNLMSKLTGRKLYAVEFFA